MTKLPKFLLIIITVVTRPSGVFYFSTQVFYCTHKIILFEEKHLAIYRIRENFRVGKLSRLVHKMTIRGKTFAVHQAVANMFCTQLVIQGENFRDRLKNRKKRKTHLKVFPYTV